MASGLLLILAATSLFVYTYSYFADLIDQRLTGQVFNNASLVFAAPTEIAVGEEATPEELAGRLRKAFYSQGGSSTFGTYRITGDQIEINPGRD